MSMFMSALAVLAAASPEAANLSRAGKAVDAAARGLWAVIEDDANPDDPLRSVKTRGCVTTIRATRRRWRVDWRTARGVGLGDASFVYVDALPAPFAIVTDPGKGANGSKIAALSEAMSALMDECRSATR